MSSEMLAADARPDDANGVELILRFWIPPSGPDKKEHKLS